MNIEKDIDFILSHFDNATLFPRTMMTKKRNYQFEVYSKEEIVKGCIDSDYIDCRINAYPSYTRWEKYEMARYPPNFIFIDMDLSNFSRYKNPRNVLDKALSNTLEKISSSFLPERSYHSQHSQLLYPNSNNNQDDHEDTQTSFTVNPTVLWSGNGYHIYLPIKALVLDQYPIFSRDKFSRLFSRHLGKYSNHSISETFLIFAKDYFTNGKADPQHRPSLNSCLIRIPNTINSKCMEDSQGEERSWIKIVQKWSEYRPSIQLLTKYFLRWLYQGEINQKIVLKKKSRRNLEGSSVDSLQIRWIEDLLQRGIYDGRKETLRLILGPYLIKRKSYVESFSILQEWLNRCNEIRQLDRDFYPQQRIKSSLNNTKGFLKIENLRIKYSWLYEIIK